MAKIEIEKAKLWYFVESAEEALEAMSALNHLAGSLPTPMAAQEELCKAMRAIRDALADSNRE